MSPSYSRPAPKARSLDQSLVHVKPRSMTTSNVLFLGGTDVGESSIIDFIAGPGEQKITSRRTLGDDVRNMTLHGKIFNLHALPTSESVSPVALREAIQNILADLRSNGGIHLLVYCMDALHPTLWVHEVHSTIASSSTLSSPIPVVAVIVGTSDVAQQESWWSRSEDALSNEGLHFDDHAFIRMMSSDAQSPIGDHISESRHILHTLILQNCAYVPNSATKLDLQSGSPSSRTSAGSKGIDIVLLGEVGVGKSSLINLIAGAKVAGVSSDTIGCTKTADKYTLEGKGETFHLYDTPGLVHPQMGVKPFVDPIDTIQSLIHSLGNGNGPDLLLFCIDNSKPTVAVRRNYRLFYKIICESKVPFALAITKLGEGQGADQWWSEHGTTIRGYGIDCLGHIGIGCEKRHSDPSLDSEGQLRESLLSFFVTCTCRRKHGISSLRSSMGRMVGSVTSFLRFPVPTLEKILMDQCGLEAQTAWELANRVVSSKQSHSDRVYT